MATLVDEAITGDDQPYNAVPWFWCYQYDLNLQTVGLSVGFDDLVIRGDPTTRSFSIVYLAGRGVIALDCVNLTRDYVQDRAFVVAGATPNPTPRRQRL